MNKYNEIEVKTAQNLLKEGYKWIAREKDSKIWAYKNKPHRDKDQLYCTWNYNGDYFQICTKHVPIFLNVTCADKEPVSLESIVNPQILDDAERRSLSAVIKPFRDKVINVGKFLNIATEEEYIAIDIGEERNMVFPDFEANTMYKGMFLRKWYTPEELGL